VPLPELSRRDFNRFRALILERCGIRVPDKKMLLLKNRIGKRLRALGYDSFSKYFEYVSTDKGGRAELDNMWSAITTNQTYFFREPHHFDALRKHALKQLRVSRGESRKIRVWSAGCSSGQEVYTLAAVLLDFFDGDPSWRVTVLGTDIDGEMLAQADVGRYPAEVKREIPAKYMLRYFTSNNGTVEVRDELRRVVSFRRQNLREPASWMQRLDIIFCRNVIMYLDKQFRAELSAFFHQRLRDDGYLFLGSSESMQGQPRIFETVKLGKTLAYRKILARKRGRR
jgi:chemotaxis protein methyltransferase CheR